MKSIRLLQAIGGADDELLSAYEQDIIRRPRERAWVRRGVLSACLCIVAVGVIAISGLLSKNRAAPPYSQVAAEEPAPSKPVPIIDGSSVTGPQSAASYIIPEPGTTLFFVEVRDAIDRYRGSSALLFLAVNINDASEKILSDDSEEMRMETKRLASLGYEIGWYEAWTYQGEGEKTPYTFLYVLLPVDEADSFAAKPEYGYSFYFPNNGDGSAVEYAGTGEIINAETASENTGTPLGPRELSEAEAYAAIGAYLPSSPPEGFAFESAYHADGAVSVTWTRGYSSFNWTISDMSEADAARQTPVANTENYDLSLYPVPRAQSVPEERREVVNAPIFTIEELTQEVVDMRADNSGEPGDEGIRMRFGVHYSAGGMLVEISSKGVAPEWVYEQLKALPR